MADKQSIAVFGVLAFLGTFAALGASLGVLVGAKLLGEKRLSRWANLASGWIFGGRGLSRKLAAVAIALAAGYAAVLFGASLTSHERTLPPGEQKYFCEIDCHLAYSIAGVQKTKTLGAAPNVLTASGSFYVVTVRTWFDPRTISEHRPRDIPLIPSPREILLADSSGRRFGISAGAQAHLERTGKAGELLTTALRPGESYISRLAFDVPPDAENPRLLILSPTEPKWIGRVLIGDENSLLHRKVYLQLPT